MAIDTPSKCCADLLDMKAIKPSVILSVLRIGLALLVLVLAESIIESYAQFWTANYDAIPLDQLTEDADIVNALLLTLAALVLSLICFPLIGWLAVVKQSKLMANYFATMSVLWAIYVIAIVEDMPLSNVTFVTSLAATSVTYAYKLHQPAPVHDSKMK